MDLVTGILSFIVIWWISLFVVLPFGARSQIDDGDVTHGTEPGAPAKNNIVKKALITTLLASIIWLTIFTAIEFELFSLVPIDSDPWGANAQ